MSVEFTFTSIRYEHPPFVRLSFDVTLHNTANAQRWFLLPANLEHGIVETVSTARVYRLGDAVNGQVVIARFSETYGFYALLLPAAAHVTLRQLPMRIAGKYPSKAQLEAVIAETMEVGGEPAEAWFKMDALSSARADVSASTLASERDVIAVRHAPDNKAVPVALHNAQRLSVEVELSTPQTT